MMQELVDRYLTTLQVEGGYATNTIESYRRDLRKLANFFRSHDIADPKELSKPLWVQFLSSLHAEGLSSASMGRCLRAMTSSGPTSHQGSPGKRCVMVSLFWSALNVPSSRQRMPGPG
jgi:hypothetical protein